MVELVNVKLQIHVCTGGPDLPGVSHPLSHNRFFISSRDSMHQTNSLALDVRLTVKKVSQVSCFDVIDFQINHS